jgi:hypothetical protein
VQLTEEDSTEDEERRKTPRGGLVPGKWLVLRICGAIPERGKQFEMGYARTAD